MAKAWKFQFKVRYGNLRCKLSLRHAQSPSFTLRHASVTQHFLSWSRINAHISLIGSGAGDEERRRMAKSSDSEDSVLDFKTWGPSEYFQMMSRQPPWSGQGGIAQRNGHVIVDLAHHFGGDQGRDYFAEIIHPVVLKACKSFSYRSASSNLSKSSLKECQESDPPRIYGLPRRLTLYSQKPRLLRLPRSNFPHAKAPPAKRDKRLWGWEWKLAGRESTLREYVVCWKYSSSRIF